MADAALLVRWRKTPVVETRRRNDSTAICPNSNSNLDRQATLVGKIPRLTEHCIRACRHWLLVHPILGLPRFAQDALALACPGWTVTNRRHVSSHRTAGASIHEQQVDWGHTLHRGRGRNASNRVCVCALAACLSIYEVAVGGSASWQPAVHRDRCRTMGQMLRVDTDSTDDAFMSDSPTARPPASPGGADSISLKTTRSRHVWSRWALTWFPGRQPSFFPHPYTARHLRSVLLLESRKILRCSKALTESPDRFACSLPASTMFVQHHSNQLSCHRAEMLHLSPAATSLMLQDRNNHCHAWQLTNQNCFKHTILTNRPTSSRETTASTTHAASQTPDFMKHLRQYSSIPMSQAACPNQ